MAAPCEVWRLMGSVVAPWGVWCLHGECGGSMGSVAAPLGVWWLHGKCGGSMGSVVSVAAPWGVWRLHKESTFLATGKKVHG